MSLRTFGISVRQEDEKKLKEIMETLGVKKRSEAMRLAINLAWNLVNGKHNPEVAKNDKFS